MPLANNSSLYGTYMLVLQDYPCYFHNSNINVAGKARKAAGKVGKAAAGGAY